MTDPEIYVIGERWLIPVKLKKDSELFDVSTGTVSARLLFINDNAETEEIGSTALGSTTEGADWDNGLVVVDWSAVETAAISSTNNLFVEISANVDSTDYVWPTREIEVEESDFISIPLLPMSDLADAVYLELPDAPKPLINLKLNDIIVDFCKRTHAWQETITFTATADTDTYILPSNGLAKILDIRSVTSQNYPYNPDSYYLNDCEIVFDGNYTPSEDSDVEIVISLIPIGTKCPDFFITHYKRELVAGALSRLMKMPKRPFTDIGLAAYYEKEYFKAVGQELGKQANRGVYAGGGITG